MTSKAALLRSDHFTEQAADSTMTMQKTKEEIRQVSRSLTFKVRRPTNRLDVTLKRKKERCQILPHYISWPLLLAVGVACVALVSFHLWFTWHLQRKVEVLQSRVESLSNVEFEELRVQLRNLYDLYDASAEMKNGHLGHLAFADRNQEADEPGEILLMDLGDVDGEKSTTLLNDVEGNPIEKDITVFSSIHTPLALSEMTRLDMGGDRQLAKTGRVAKLEHDAQATGRQKRQADLSSHTQDGVPIFDRGYGATPNRTEGLRIYQSLLANGGKNQPRSSDPSVQVTDTVAQPPHRGNHFWRNRKDKPRHRHRTKPSTRSPLDDDIELSSMPEFDAANGQDVRSSETTSSPSKSSVAPNVEFRHSRVKTSSDGAGRDSVPLSVDQNVWATSRSNGIFVIGNAPYSGSSQEDRISAATAPAILTKTVAASVGPSASSPTRLQPNVYKVNQPAVNSRASAQGSNENGQLGSRDPLPSPPSRGKKRVNKKQLRDLSHTATAVHLVADTRNASSANFENQEIASRNELGLHTSWKIAQSNWDSPLKTTPLVKIDGATLTVKQSGLYFIYAQVHYLDEHSTNAYEVFVNTEPFLRCITSSFSESSFPKANTCYTAAATQLREGDKLFIRDIEPLRYSVLQPSKTFFGLIRMAPMADFS